jgi:hypothetical protein
VDEALGQEQGGRPGVTNRPAAEERQEQEQEPPRGQRKREGGEPDLEHKTDWEGRAHGE